MNRRSILSLSTMMALGFVFLAGDAVAQQTPLKEQLVGTWTIVSADNTRPGGTKSPVFGPNPKGTQIYDTSGRFAWSVNESDKTIITRIEASTFPNQEGQDQKRIITSVTADELRYVNPATTTGDKAETVWKRVK